MELDYGFQFNGRLFWVRQWQDQGLTLDPLRNQLDFYKNSLNQNQQLLDSRYVAEEPADNQGFTIGFHGIHQNRSSGHRICHSVLGIPPPQKKRSYLFSSVEDEYAPRLWEKMGESYEYQHQELHQHQQPADTGSSRLGFRNSGGEIVEVQGGHIVRSTGRKDRHSKVCTAKGPRDRRVRLSAHTAIQFYDVQDRLGYDRPSKAVDWLIKKAKAAIDELAELPAWKPAAAATAANTISALNFEQSPDQENTNDHELNRFNRHHNYGIVNNQMSNAQSSSFLPPSLDSDAIADTIKSFFPMVASPTPVNTNSSAMQFHHNFPPSDLLSRSNNQSQDLRLSLQSFKDPILHHHQQNEENSNTFLDDSGWRERMVGWGGGGSGSGNGNDAVTGGFVFSSTPPQPTPFHQTLFSQTTNNQLVNNISQRGPLQSSFPPSIRAWIDQPQFASAAIDHLYSGFTLTGGGFSGFLIPACIQGEEEEHDGNSDKPSSASSDSRQ